MAVTVTYESRGNLRWIQFAFTGSDAAAAAVNKIDLSNGGAWGKPGAVRIFDIGMTASGTGITSITPILSQNTGSKAEDAIQLDAGLKVRPMLYGGVLQQTPDAALYVTATPNLTAGDCVITGRIALEFV